MIKATLRPLLDANGKHVRGIYESVDGGMEPIYSRHVERGEVIFAHQSGYGYLPASEVRVVIEGAAHYG